MTTTSVTAGDTFVIDPSGGANNHLWVVLYVFTPDYDFVEHAIIVNVTSLTKFADRTCILNAEAHDFVKHDSYVYYAEMRELEVSRLLGIGGGNRHQPVSDTLLARIREGLHQSPHTPRGFKAKVPR